MTFSLMALTLAMLAQDAPNSAPADATPPAATPAPDAPVEPRIVCKNIEVTGSRLAKKKKVCLPEGEWSESARRNMKSGSGGKR
ncbi:MAG: hypothetical protein ACKOPR_11400 [Chakrabartia godavariana]